MQGVRSSFFFNDTATTEISTADEVFIPSTNGNVIGIREFAGRKISNGPTGAVTKRLDVAFDAFVMDYVERRLAANRSTIPRHVAGWWLSPRDWRKNQGAAHKRVL